MSQSFGEDKPDGRVAVLLDDPGLAAGRDLVVFVLEIEDAGVDIVHGPAQRIPGYVLTAGLLDIIVDLADDAGLQVQDAGEGLQGRRCLDGGGDEDQPGAFVVRARLQEQRQGETAQGMADIGIEGAIVLLDDPQDADVFREGDPSATGIAVGGGIEGDYLIASGDQGGDAGFEIAGGGFKEEPDFGMPAINTLRMAEVTAASVNGSKAL